ncbi:hypothetical protein CsSME_00031852 [Camellia sinensis var. sinensis]
MHSPCPGLIIPWSHGPSSGVTILWLKYVICSRYQRFLYGTGQSLGQPATKPPRERPLVILGLLAGYDTKPLGAGLGHDRVVSEHKLYRTHESI